VLKEIKANANASTICNMAKKHAALCKHLSLAIKETPYTDMNTKQTSIRTREAWHQYGAIEVSKQIATPRVNRACTKITTRLPFVSRAKITFIVGARG
jgi:hypothetical protein